LVLGTVLVNTLYLGLNAVFVLGAPASLLAGKVDVGRITPWSWAGRAWPSWFSALIAFVLATASRRLPWPAPDHGAHGG